MTARTSAATIAALLRQSSAKCELRSILQARTRPTTALVGAATSTSTLTTPRNLNHLRSLHTTPVWLKKKSREDKEQARASRHAPDADSSSGSSKGNNASSNTGASQRPTPTAEDVLDFADVEARLVKIASNANESLKKIKAGGRFNPDLIGAVKVQPDRKEAASYPLRELASVIPKGGRTISILVHEEANIKPIMSAVQSHRDFNQQPQRSPDNELELILKVEAESREDVAKRIKAICHDWRERIRDVRQRRDKLHAAWKKDGSLLPDAKRKADTELDKVIKAEVAKVDAAEKETTKATESR